MEFVFRADALIANRMPAFLYYHNFSYKAGGDYHGEIIECVKTRLRYCLQAILRFDVKKFVVLPKHWTVEGVFYGWAIIGDYQKITND